MAAPKQFCQGTRQHCMHSDEKMLGQSGGAEAACMHWVCMYLLQHVSHPRVLLLALLFLAGQAVPGKSSLPLHATNVSGQTCAWLRGGWCSLMSGAGGTEGWCSRWRSVSVVALGCRVWAVQALECIYQVQSDCCEMDLLVASHVAAHAAVWSALFWRPASNQLMALYIYIFWRCVHCLLLCCCVSREPMTHVACMGLRTCK